MTRTNVFPFILFYFLRTGEISVRILPLPSGALPQIYNKGPTPSSREAIKCSGNVHVRIDHTPFFLISREEKYLVYLERMV